MSLMLETEVREAAPGITVVKFSGRITTGPESAGIEVLAGSQSEDASRSVEH
jgi:hypothetical protein